MKRKAFLGLAIALALAGAAGAFAQEEKKAMPEMTPEQKAEMEMYMKAATPGPQHQWLASTAGNYDIKIKGWQESGGPAMESTGTAVRTAMFDGRVLVEDVNSAMMGMPFKGHGMRGYDNVSGKFWGTWVDSMGTGLMVSEGSCDDKGSCTFTGSWNDPVKKGPMHVRMTSRWTSPTTEVFEMHGPDKAGKEFKMMEITYTKKM